MRTIHKLADEIQIEIDRMKYHDDPAPSIEWFQELQRDLCELTNEKLIWSAGFDQGERSGFNQAKEIFEEHLLKTSKFTPISRFTENLIEALNKSLESIRGIQ